MSMTPLVLINCTAAGGKVTFEIRLARTSIYLLGDLSWLKTRACFALFLWSREDLSILLELRICKAIPLFSQVNKQHRDYFLTSYVKRKGGNFLKTWWIYFLSWFLHCAIIATYSHSSNSGVRLRNNDVEN